MPFPDASFEAAYTQHVAMNIEDKARLYGEVWRVLKPGGRFGIDLLQGGGEVLYPVPWARDTATSFLVRPDELRRLLEDAGLRYSAGAKPPPRPTSGWSRPRRAWPSRTRNRMRCGCCSATMPEGSQEHLPQSARKPGGANRGDLPQVLITGALVEGARWARSPA